MYKASFIFHTQFVTSSNPMYYDNQNLVSFLINIRVKSYFLIRMIYEYSPLVNYFLIDDLCTLIYTLGLIIINSIRTISFCIK